MLQRSKTRKTGSRSAAGASLPLEAETMGYQAAYDRSLSDPDAFCADAARLIDWDRPWERVLDASRPPFYRWFSGASLNTCWNAVDRHVAAGRGDQAAIIHDSPVTDSKMVISYRDLKDRVARFAGALRDQGVEKGDRVIIYMPMVPEAAIAMLACARIGAIHSVVFGGFSSRELATRIDDAKPKVMVAGSCGIEPNRVVHYKPLLDQAIALANHQVGRCIVLQRPQEPGTLIPRPGHRLVGSDVRGKPGRLRLRHGHRPPLHPLYVWDHRPAKGRGPRQR
jgi:propionyl-CoA synthetase